MPASVSWGEIDRLCEHGGKERLPDHSWIGSLSGNALGSGCFRTSPHSAFADGGACRRATPAPPTPRAVRSGGRFGSRVRPYIAMDNTSGRCHAAGRRRFRRRQKDPDRLPIDVDDLAMPVDFQSANGIVDGERDQRGIEWALSILCMAAFSKSVSLPAATKPLNLATVCSRYLSAACAGTGCLPPPGQVQRAYPP